MIKVIVSPTQSRNSWTMSNVWLLRKSVIKTNSITLICMRNRLRNLTKLHPWKTSKVLVITLARPSISHNVLNRSRSLWSAYSAFVTQSIHRTMIVSHLMKFIFMLTENSFLLERKKLTICLLKLLEVEALSLRNSAELHLHTKKLLHVSVVVTDGTAKLKSGKFYIANSATTGSFFFLLWMKGFLRFLWLKSCLQK